MGDVAMNADVSTQIGGGGVLAGGGAMGQLVSTRSRYHRKKRPQTLYRNVLYRQPPYVTCYFGGLTKFGVTDPSGQTTNSTRYWKLRNVQATNAYWPLHMFCLTNRVKWSSEDSRSTAYELYQKSAAPNHVAWGTLAGQDGDLTATENMCLWRSNIAAYPEPALSQASKSVLGNVRIEFLLQGTRGYPVTFQIWVMKFANENLDPMYMYYDQSNAGNDDADEFYSTLLRRDVANPIMSMPAMVETYGRAVVLYKRNYTIMPDSSTNYDLTAGQIRAKLDINLNRYLHWDWVPKANQVSFKSLDDPTWKPVYPGAGAAGSENMATFLRRPQDRIWLMVKASNYCGVSTGSEDVNNQPSYDMRILTTHTVRRTQ